MQYIKSHSLKIIFILVLVFIFIFCLFFDISLSTNNFPILTTVYFVIFMIFRFLRPYLR